nr:MAG TPA: hypothetical protein [Bacteriophage sp.]
MMEKPTSHSLQPKPQNFTQALCNLLMSLPFILLLAVPLVAVTVMALLFLMPLLAILWMLLYPLWPLLLLLLLLLLLWLILSLRRK